MKNKLKQNITVHFKQDLKQRLFQSALSEHPFCGITEIHRRVDDSLTRTGFKIENINIPEGFKVHQVQIPTGISPKF